MPTLMPPIVAYRKPKSFSASRNSVVRPSPVTLKQSNARSPELLLPERPVQEAELVGDDGVEQNAAGGRAAPTGPADATRRIPCRPNTRHGVWNVTFSCASAISIFSVRGEAKRVREDLVRAPRHTPLLAAFGASESLTTAHRSVMCNPGFVR